MTYTYKVLEDGPIGLWPLDTQSGSTYVDVSGFSNTATIAGGMANAKPIVALGIGGQIMTGAGFTLPITGLMTQNAQSKPFSYEFWFKHQSATGTGTLFKRTTSGVSITGNTITVTLSMSTTITISYAGLLIGEVYYGVVSYDGSYVSLWLNGIRVASATINPADYNAGFTDSAATLSFAATGGYSILLDGLAIYNYALHNEQIQDHYQQGLQYPDVVRISGFNNSHQWEISDSQVSVFLRMLADVKGDWSIGTFSGSLSILSDNLVNNWSDTTGQYASGTWQQTINIEPQALVLAGSRITWDSNKTNSDLVVEISTNQGTTWTAVSNGSSPIGALDVTTGANIIIRLTLAAGATQTFVRRLNFVLYSSKNIVGSNSLLPIVVTDPVSSTLAEYDYEQSSFNDNLGINLSSATNKLTVPVDNTFGGYLAIEMLVKFSTSTASKTILSGNAASAQPTITTDASGNWVSANITALYVDGVSVSLTSFLPSANTWHHVVAVFASKQNDFYIGNNAAGTSAYPVRVGYVAAYLAAPTAAMVTAIYNGWVGAAPVRVTDSSICTIREHVISGGLPCRGYSLDWSVSSAG